MINGVVVLSDTESFKYQIIIIIKFISGKLYADEAATLLKCSKRNITRYAKRVKEKGYLGVKHGNYNRESTQKVDPKIRKLVMDLKQKEYFDYNCKHFYDILVSDYSFKYTYQTLWRWLKENHMVKNPRARRRKKHVYRPRMPQEGLLLQNGNP